MADVKIRTQPHTNNVSNEKFVKGTPFQISAIVPDQLDPLNSGKRSPTMNCENGHTASLNGCTSGSARW